MYKKNFWVQWTIISALLVISIWFLNNSFAGNEDRYLKTDKGLFYLRQVFETISRNYVDNVDPEGLSKSAIRGIVGELDPYTVFIEKQGSERLDIITKGKYGGLGMEIGKRGENITIISPMDDTPAHKAGLRAGDVIMKIDDESTKDMSLEDASNKLRGKIGTDVTIEIKRPGLSEPITKKLVREEIVLKDVSIAEFIEPNTAYFRLSNFSEKAAAELKQAVHKLQQEGEIDRVILDLRGNPGGLLIAAVDVANVFIPKGELIVQTKGEHERDAKFLTKNEALLPDIPLVVLVNKGSASASEIVAGAVQDLDRGIIVGTSTFGKGLVQQVYPVDKINDAFLKITTAKYYIPSGRCIQKEDYKKNREVFSEIPDSTEFNNHIKYYTRNKRVVYGGGGIKPDVQELPDRMDDYLTALWAEGHFFRFTVDYLAAHPDIKNDTSFEITDQVLNDFRNYLSGKKIEFEIEGEAQLKKFLTIARDENYDESVQNSVNAVLQKLEEEKLKEYDRNVKQIRESLETEFAEKLGESSQRTIKRLNNDKVLHKALTVLHNRVEYNTILAVK
jgi:carboxyl-terminal processing protease